MHRKDLPPVVTIADVARRAGVSISTVSRVVNTSAPVNDDTSARVREAILSLGYIPQTAARNLASRKTNALGLLLPGIGGDFFSVMLSGIEDSVAEAGYDLLVATLHSTRTHRPRLPFGPHNTDGLLVFTGNLRDSGVLPLHEGGFPIVLLYEAPPEGVAIPSVTVENKDGTRAMIDHLIEVHHLQRILFLQGPEVNEDSHWRERGYRESLERHGIPFDPTLIAMGGYYEEDALRTVHALLRNGMHFDAIFGGSDEGAIGAMLALSQAGLRVPQDVAVAGFDDLTLARYMTPPLTTVRAPTAEVGRQAVQQLLRLIHTGEADALTLLPTELVIRQSCGCP